MKNKSNNLNRNHDWEHAKHVHITVIKPNGEKVDVEPYYPEDDLLDVHFGTYESNNEHNTSPNLIPLAIFNADGTTTYLPQASVIVGSRRSDND